MSDSPSGLFLVGVGVDRSHSVFKASENPTPCQWDSSFDLCWLICCCVRVVAAVKRLLLLAESVALTNCNDSDSFRIGMKDDGSRRFDWRPRGKLKPNPNEYNGHDLRIDQIVSID